MRKLKKVAKRKSIGHTSVHTVIEVECDADPIQITEYRVDAGMAHYAVVHGDHTIGLDGIEFAAYCAARPTAPVIYIPQVLKNEA